MARSSVAARRMWFAAASSLIAILCAVAMWTQLGRGEPTLEQDLAQDPRAEEAIQRPGDPPPPNPVVTLPSTGAGVHREDPAAEAAAIAAKAAIRVQVVERNTGLPVRGVEIQTLPSRAETLLTDEEGRVEFLANPGPLELLLECEGTPYFCGEPDAPQDSEWIAAWDEVESEQRYEASAQVMRSAAILGRWLPLSGKLQFRPNLYWSPQVDDAWGRATAEPVDEDGSFQISRLAAGTYLLGPDPMCRQGFPFEIVTITWGEEKTIEVRELEKVKVRVTVSAQQEGSGAPWPLPLEATLFRRDTMSSLIPRSRYVSSAVRQALKPHTEGPGSWVIEKDLAPGNYHLQMRSGSRVSPQGLSWVGFAWEEGTEVVVKSGEPLALDFEFETPTCGDVAWVNGTVMGAKSAPRIKGTYSDQNERTRDVRFSLAKSEDGLWSFRLGAPLHLIPDGQLQIQQLTDTDWETLQSLTLAPGEQAVTVTAR